MFGDKGELVIYVAYGLIGLGTYLVTRMLVAEQETRLAQDNLADQRDRKASNSFVKFARPLFSNYVVPMIRGKPFWEEQRQKYRRKIISGGLKDELTPDEFIAFKIFNIAFFPIVGGLLKAGEFLDLQWYWILASGGVGWFYPDIWVNSRMAARQKQILRALPFTVDLLALSTEAGLDFVGAIGKVVDKSAPSPLVDEFAQLLKEIKVGSSRQEALREMSLRIGMTEVNSFVAILISADQMGASIGKILRQQSDQIRNERMMRAEKEAAKAQTKLLFPIMLFMVPAVLIMVMGPVVVGMIYGYK